MVATGLNIWLGSLIQYSVYDKVLFLSDKSSILR